MRKLQFSTKVIVSLALILPFQIEEDLDIFSAIKIDLKNGSLVKFFFGAQK